jgi:hypothetical protein
LYPCRIQFFSLSFSFFQTQIVGLLPHAKAPPWWTRNRYCPHEPSITPPPEPTIEGRGSFPIHGILLRRHHWEHPWLPHPGECLKWVIRDLSCYCHLCVPGLPPTTGDEISPVWDSSLLHGPSLRHLRRGPPLSLQETCWSMTIFSWHFRKAS